MKLVWSAVEFGGTVLDGTDDIMLILGSLFTSYKTVSMMIRV